MVPRLLALGLAVALVAVVAWLALIRRSGEPPPGQRAEQPIEREQALKTEIDASQPPISASLDSAGNVPIETLPVPTRRVSPVYPPRALSMGFQGEVRVRALVGPDGKVEQVRVEQSVPELDDAALAAVSQWQFEPARVNGKPVAAWVVVPVRFRLRS